MKLTWSRQQAGMHVGFDDRGNAIGYVFQRGGSAWAASGPVGYVVCESLGKAKAEVTRQINHPESPDSSRAAKERP